MYKPVSGDFYAQIMLQCHFYTAGLAVYITLSILWRHSYTTSRASTVRCRLSDRRRATPAPEPRTLPNRSLFTTARIAVIGWHSWVVTLLLRRNLINLPGWPRRVFGKLASASPAAAITAMNQCLDRSKTSRTLLRPTPIMSKELASKASGVNMLNWSAHADTQQQVAAARRLLRAGGLQRYTA